MCKSGSIGTVRGNSAVCRAQGRVETRLCAGHRVTWIPGSVLGTGSRVIPALCRVQGCVETWLCASYLVTWKPGCLFAVGLPWNPSFLSATVQATRSHGTPAVCWPQSRVEIQLCPGHSVAWKSGPKPADILAVGKSHISISRVIKFIQK